MEVPDELDVPSSKDNSPGFRAGSFAVVASPSFNEETLLATTSLPVVSFSDPDASFSTTVTGESDGECPARSLEGRYLSKDDMLGREPESEGYEAGEDFADRLYDLWHSQIIRTLKMYQPASISLRIAQLYHRFRHCHKRLSDRVGWYTHGGEG